MVITEFLDLSAMLVPERTAIAFEGKRFSYAQLKERVNRLADSLSRLGLKKGERAAIIEVNCNEYVEACFATVKLGGIFVPLNFRIREEELIYLVNKAEPKILFVGSRYADMVKSVKPKLTSVKHFIVIGGEYRGMLSYDELIAAGSPEEKTFAQVVMKIPSSSCLPPGPPASPRESPRIAIPIAPTS